MLRCSASSCLSYLTDKHTVRQTGVLWRTVCPGWFSSLNSGGALDAAVSFAALAHAVKSKSPGTRATSRIDRRQVGVPVFRPDRVPRQRPYPRLCRRLGADARRCDMPTVADPQQARAG